MHIHERRLPSALRYFNLLSNPARSSSLVAEVFPDTVVAAELRSAADASLLYPAERAFCTAFAHKRVSEFTAGRLCARRALSELGIFDFPIAINPDRTPRWPTGIVGSISHTDGYGCAVVAFASVVASVGVDVEIVGRVTPELHALLFTVSERTFLASLATVERMRAATVIFSAKEAFYKCQFMVSRRWLDFHDVSLELTTSDLLGGVFRVAPADDKPALDAAVPLPLLGQFRIDGDLCVTGVTLPA